MIRQAVSADIITIADTYQELLTYERQNGSNSNWKAGIYPTIKVPEEKVPGGSMFVLEENGEICASMVLNKEQAQEYGAIDWLYPAAPDQVLVIHTLCIPPRKAGHGYGRQMVGYAKEYAAKAGCSVIRIDTYYYNEPAKKLYRSNGFRVAGSGMILLQGLIQEEQIYMEYKLQEGNG